MNGTSQPVRKDGKQARQVGNLPSVWINLLVFGILILLVLAMFFWQLHKTRNSMQQSSRERASMVASIIEADLHNAELARQTIDGIVHTYLRDSGRFIQYLDEIEPFNPEELSAFSRQAGLAGITIIRHAGSRVSGPADWFPDDLDCQGREDTIQYREADGLGFLVLHPRDGNGSIDCIYIGLDAAPILDLHEHISLPSLLATLSALPGIRYVRLEEAGEISTTQGSAVRLLEDNGRFTAEARIQIRQGLLVVGLNAHRFHQRITALKNQFFLFSFVLFFLGLFFSWLLYRYQQAGLEQTRQFERMLAAEHEAAALGRATGTIAHEIRNPLNTIDMGLQRLRMEGDNLDIEQEELITAMRGAVHRTSTIVTELLRFTRPLVPELRPVVLAALIEDALLLHKGSCERLQIELRSDLAYTEPILADEHLLAELVENLVQNCIEAQQDGGLITIGLERKGDTIVLMVTNGPCSLAVNNVQQLLEPYYTTKTRGTGLGLPFCRRVAEAHGGRLEIGYLEKERVFRVRLLLPMSSGSAATAVQKK